MSRLPRFHCIDASIVAGQTEFNIFAVYIQAPQSVEALSKMFPTALEIDGCKRKSPRATGSACPCVALGHNTLVLADGYDCPRVLRLAVRCLGRPKGLGADFGTCKKRKVLQHSRGILTGD